MLLCGESNSKLNHMKVRTILFAALSLAALHVNAQRIKGSDTVLPVAQQTAERFMNREPDGKCCPDSPPSDFLQIRDSVL